MLKSNLLLWYYDFIIIIILLLRIKFDFNISILNELLKFMSKNQI